MDFDPPYGGLNPPAPASQSPRHPDRAMITLTTDFGRDSPYVAAMKGVILSLNPAVTLVDLTHSVPPQDIRQGALALTPMQEAVLDLTDGYPLLTNEIVVC